MLQGLLPEQAFSVTGVGCQSLRRESGGLRSGRSGQGNLHGKHDTINAIATAKLLERIGDDVITALGTE